MRRIGFLLVAILFVTGCGGKSTYVVQQYLLDYSPPAPAGLLRRPTR